MKSLLVRSEEEVVSRIRHEDLLADVAGCEASGNRSGSPIGVEALDESSSG